MRLLFLLLFMGALGIIGCVCLFLPDKVQGLAVRSVGQGPARPPVVLEQFVQSHEYLIAVRAVGAIALLGLVLLAWGLLRS
jgi:hypothetical protein